MKKSKIEKIMLIIAASIIFLGTTMLIIGYIIPYITFPSDPLKPSISLLRGYIFNYSLSLYIKIVDTMGLIVLAFTAIILVASILTIISCIAPKFTLFENTNTMFISLAIYLFIPIILPGYFYSPFTLLLDSLTYYSQEVAYTKISGTPDEIAFGPGYYLLIVGISLILLSFLFTTVLFFIERTRRKNTETKIRIKENYHSLKIFRIIISGIAIFSSILFCLGIILPIRKRLFREGSIPPDYRSNYYSFLFNKYWNVDYTISAISFDFTMLFYFTMIIGIITLAIILIYQNLRKNTKASLLPILISLIFISIFPYTSPYYGDSILLFQSPLMEFLAEIQYFIILTKIDETYFANGTSNTKLVMTFTGWLLLVSIVLIIITLFAVILNLIIERKYKTISSSEDEKLDNYLIAEKKTQILMKIYDN